MIGRIALISADERAQAMVEYALVALTAVVIALAIMAVFSTGMFKGIAENATRAMVTEVPVNNSLWEAGNDVLDLLAF